ncbi:hypothetical protein DB31_3867 [Hyalangium minutum]|uniref:Uncharacterized protein n=1 Tax=Hyalangium minutum TaxID=394096 RepID=A0A085W4Z0_9BACT|nr:hypothetical protein DB31_3867 [Hyalangium minutum]
MRQPAAGPRLLWGVTLDSAPCVVLRARARAGHPGQGGPSALPAAGARERPLDLFFLFLLINMDFHSHCRPFAAEESSP